MSLSSARRKKSAGLNPHKSRSSPTRCSLSFAVRRLHIVYMARCVRFPERACRSPRFAVAFCVLHAVSISSLSLVASFFFFENYRETTRTAVARREARATFDHSPNTGMAVATAGDGGRSVFSFSASLFSRSPSPVNVKKKAPKCVDSLLDYIFFDM